MLGEYNLQFDYHSTPFMTARNTCEKLIWSTGRDTFNMRLSMALLSLFNGWMVDGSMQSSEYIIIITALARINVQQKCSETMLKWWDEGAHSFRRKLMAGCHFNNIELAGDSPSSFCRNEFPVYGQRSLRLWSGCHSVCGCWSECAQNHYSPR